MTRKGFTVWFTGLPGSGKSTLARLLKEELSKRDETSEILDGDEIRKHLTKGLGYSRADREENIRRIAFVSSLLTKVGGIAVTAAISPYQESRFQARQVIQDFFEVFVDCPIEVCIQRDPKGLYAKANRGDIQNFTGVSDPYEKPTNPELTLHTNTHSPEECIRLLLDKLEDLQYLPKISR